MPGISEIAALSHKKYRQRYELFKVEGVKLVKEALKQNKYTVVEIILSEDFNDNSFNCEAISHRKISPASFKKCSSHKSPQNIMAILSTKNIKPTERFSSLAIYCDSIRDPGNLGTIIRTADWFGINPVYISPDTVEPYNPKVLQSTMSSIFYVDIEERMAAELTGANLICSTLDGVSVHDFTWPEKGILVIGNESHGAGAEILKLSDHKIKIEGSTSGGAESLNAAMAASILMYDYTLKKMSGDLTTTT